MIVEDNSCLLELNIKNILNQILPLNREYPVLKPELKIKVFT
jgi:hypothetical protein